MDDWIRDSIFVTNTLTDPPCHKTTHRLFECQCYWCCERFGGKTKPLTRAQNRQAKPGIKCMPLSCFQLSLDFRRWCSSLTWFVCLTSSNLGLYDLVVIYIISYYWLIMVYSTNSYLNPRLIIFWRKKMKKLKAARHNFEGLTKAWSSFNKLNQCF